MQLSIIIPVYNVEDTLSRCVESVLSQSFTDYEVILVDDGATDGSPRLVDKYAEKDARIKAIHQPNQGLSAARNTGIDRSTGKYLTFIDSDDFIETDTLSQLMSLLAQHPTWDMIEYSVMERYGSKQQNHLCLPNKVYSNMNEYWLTGKAYLHSYACNKVYKRELFDKVRFPKGKTFEDVFTLPKILKEATQVATISIGTYYYCFNDKGITQNANGTDLTNLLNAHLDYIKDTQNIDAAYYAHLLNIQMDVYETTHSTPILPILPFKNTLKLRLLHILGLKQLCKLNELIHRVMRLIH